MVCIKPEKEAADQTAPAKSTGYKVFSVVRSVFIYLFAAAIIIAALLFASDKSPQKSVFGYRYYNVLTPSMEPTYSVGDMVFVKLCGAESVKVGDVITFNPSQGGEAYLTHRVVEIIENTDNTNVTCFRTKGDANDSEDSFRIDEERLIGVVKFSVPKLGMIVRFVQLKWYFVVPLIVLVGLFFYLMQLYFAGGDDEEKTKKSKEEPAEPAVSDIQEVISETEPKE